MVGVGCVDDFVLVSLKNGSLKEWEFKYLCLTVSTKGVEIRAHLENLEK